MKIILVTGGSGQVGTELQRLSWPAGFEVSAPGRHEMDLSDPGSVAAMVQSRRFAAVINAGAFTAVDLCESEVAQAWQVNAVAPAVLARATALAGIPLVQVSTDYVFDGSKATPYAETDPVGPLCVYGASKLGGELAVRTANPRHAIVRTAWVFSAHGNNFVKTMLRVGRDRPLLRVVDDQRGCPTSAADLAAALAKIALAMIADADAPIGTFQFVNSGSCTWHGLAGEIFAQAARMGGPSPQLQAITTAEYPLPARRPANSQLATGRLGREYGIFPRPWQPALADILAELLK